MSILELDHVQVTAPAGSEPEARRFYGELLGLPEIEKPEGMRATGGVWFSIGSQELHIGIEEDFAAARKAHPGLLVDAGSFDELVAKLTADGAPVAWDDRMPEQRRFYSADPFGNRLEFRAA